MLLALILEAHVYSPATEETEMGGLLKPWSFMTSLNLDSETPFSKTNKQKTQKIPFFKNLGNLTHLYSCVENFRSLSSIPVFLWFLLIP